MYVRKCVYGGRKLVPERMFLLYNPRKRVLCIALLMFLISFFECVCLYVLLFFFFCVLLYGSVTQCDRKKKFCAYWHRKIIRHTHVDNAAAGELRAPIFR